MTDLNAGPELDKLIAIKVMGIPKRQFCNATAEPVIHKPIAEYPHREERMFGYRVCGAHKDTYLEAIPAYSTDIAAAMLVIEHLPQNWIVVIIRQYKGQMMYHVGIDKVNKDGYVMRCLGQDEDESLPLAICRVVLKAKGRHD